MTEMAGPEIVQVILDSINNLRKNHYNGPVRIIIPVKLEPILSHDYFIEVWKDDFSVRKRIMQIPGVVEIRVENYTDKITAEPM